MQALLLLLFVPVMASANIGKTLSECFEATLKRSESLGVQDELLYQTNEGANQSIGAILPSINGVGTFFRQQSTGSPVFPTEQDTVKIVATQPIFRGLREYAAIRQRKALTGMQKFALQNAARLLFYDLANAYYNLLALRSDESNYRIDIEINRKRLHELEEFRKIGRSRTSEVLTQQANIASLEAKFEAVRGQYEAAKETFAFLTGFDRETPLRDDVVAPEVPDPLAKYLQHVEERPDVKEAAANVQAFEEGVAIAWGGHLPSIDVLGDYYLKRPGLQKDSHWDVQLTVTLPIFQGGVVQSQIRQASSVDRQYNLLLSQARRTAETEIRQFRDGFLSDQRQYERLGETVELAEKNYETELKDYRRSLVTNLDVLQSITTWRDAVRTWARQSYMAKADFVKLQAAAAQRKEIFIQSKRYED